MTGTAVATRPQGAAALPSLSQNSREVAVALRSSEATQDLLKASLIPSGVVREVYRLTDGSMGRTAARSEGAKAVVAKLPSPSKCAEALEALRTEVERPANSKANLAMVGILLDVFPSGRPPNLAAYLAGIVHDVTALGFTPSEVATACQTIRRSNTFLPSVAEIIAACTKARDQWRSTLALAERHAELIAKVAAIASDQQGTEGQGQ